MNNSDKDLVSGHSNNPEEVTFDYSADALIATQIMKAEEYPSYRIESMVQLSTEKSGKDSDINRECDDVTVASTTADTVHTDEIESEESNNIKKCVPGTPAALIEILQNNIEKSGIGADIAPPRLPIKKEQVLRINSTSATRMIHNEMVLRELTKGEILTSPAVITRNGIPVVRQGTINMIQGAQGSHKSRLAALLCSMMIKIPDYHVETLGFEKVDGDSIVVYIDTERNIKEEFAEAVQTIKLNAGYSVSDDVLGFYFSSLKDTPRKDRLLALKGYLNSIVKSSELPLIVFVDVVTDCVLNFNDPTESLLLYDFIGNLCENYNCTFFLVIHENPGGSKPRGHAGTEGVNKSCYVLQIGFERNNRNEVTDLLWLKEVKTRHTEKAPPLAIAFSKETKSLQVADPTWVKSVVDRRREKVILDEIAEKLSMYLTPSLPQKDLVELLIRDFGWSKNTIKTRLEEIATQKIKVLNTSDETCVLFIKPISGKPTMYELVPESPDDPG